MRPRPGMPRDPSGRLSVVAALLWLVVALVAALAAYRTGWPAWQAYRAREARDTNADRYRAWRGGARPIPSTSTHEGMTGEERRRVYAGAGLGVVAIAALLAFFATT